MHPAGRLAARWDTDRGRPASDVTDMSLAFETMSVGMALTAWMGRILRVNPTFEKMLGYLPSEIAQRSFQELTHPDDGSIGGQAMQAMLSGATTAAVIEQRYLTKDGRVIWVELNITLIMTHPFPPSYLPFVKNEALHHQYDHIRKFYSEQEDQWFLSIPYQYLNETTMTRVVNESVEAILTVYQKVKRISRFDELESSVSLLPEALMAPYQEPLGNT